LCEQEKLKILKIQQHPSPSIYPPLNNYGIPVGRLLWVRSQSALRSDANEARTLREKFTKIGVARLDRIDTIVPHYYPPALYWFMIDGLMDLTNYSGGWW
jgi:hypothetical protein